MGKRVRLTYVAFQHTVIGPLALEDALETLRTSGEDCGIVLDGDCRVLAFRKSWDAVVPTREQFDKYNERIKARVEVKALTEGSGEQ